MIESAKEVVVALKGHPLVLALIIINILFMVGGTFVLREIGANVRAERAAQTQFVRELLHCEEVRSPTL